MVMLNNAVIVVLYKYIQSIYIYIHTYIYIYDKYGCDKYDCGMELVRVMIIVILMINGCFDDVQ
jgi:hypothetical protein